MILLNFTIEYNLLLGYQKYGDKSLFIYFSCLLNFWKEKHCRCKIIILLIFVSASNSRFQRPIIISSIVNIGNENS